jgi:hypothetical protein
MGKKKFINKKTAATFSLVFRDTEGQGDDTSAEVPIRQFIRVDGGDNYIPGFTEDDHRSKVGDDDWEDEDDEDEHDADEEEDETLNGEGEDSRLVCNPSPEFDVRS